MSRSNWPCRQCAMNRPRLNPAMRMKAELCREKVRDSEE